MIKKLRRKFIFITMLLITIVLAVILSFVCVFNYNTRRQDLKTALQMEARMTNSALSHENEYPEQKTQIGFRPDKMDTARGALTFSVLIDENGSVINTISERAEIDEATLDTAIQKVLASSSSEGTLNSMNLMYCQESNDGITVISFIDTTNMVASIRDLIGTLVLAGVCALLAFLVISIFLARWAVKPVEHAWNQQKQFIADASHEIKTPLTVILANTEIILHHKYETVESQEKWLRYINDEAERMKHLVEDMLFLARSDAGRLPVVYSEVNISDLLWEVSLPFESVAFEQGLTFKSEIEPDLICSGNEQQLKELVTILLDNACKYADEKGQVDLSLKKTQDKIKIEVHNTGSYIPEDKIRHLFERFYRADEARDRQTGGYGLGLSIADSIIKLHHGHVNVTSTRQDGTTFTVLLNEG